MLEPRLIEAGDELVTPEQAKRAEQMKVKARYGHLAAIIARTRLIVNASCADVPERGLALFAFEANLRGQVAGVRDQTSAGLRFSRSKQTSGGRWQGLGIRRARACAFRVRSKQVYTGVGSSWILRAWRLRKRQARRDRTVTT
jgi:hypothetical protein